MVRCCWGSSRRVARTIGTWPARLAGDNWEGYSAMQSILAIGDIFGSDDDDSGSEGIAAAGNGGTATSSANGGAVAVGDVNSGGNSGNAIGVGDTWGGVAVDGGQVANATTLTITANGGTAISDASGGDDNVALETGGDLVAVDGDLDFVFLS